MGKTLVLMRHGKAQSRDMGIPDEDRTLTDAGKRALAAKLPQNLQLWGKHAKTVVWTSPAIRCQQTASALVDALCARGAKVPSVEDRAFLHDQDIDAFLAETAASDADCIVCIGHNPFIEEACELLTDAHIRFYPGALATLDLAGNPGASRLLWFVQGTPVEPWKTLCELEDIVKKAYMLMTERLDAFLAHPDDVETLHKLRVSIRTLRSLLKFLAPFHCKREAQAIQRDLRMIVIPTSRLRELDVLADEARQLEPPSDDLIAACERMRREERDCVLTAYAGDDIAMAIERVAQAVERLSWRKSVERNGLERTAIAHRFAEMEASIGRKLTTADLADATATHDLRKSVKRVRYAAEKFAAFLEANDAAATGSRMKAIQDDLGALCDARVNVEIIDDFPRKELSGQAIRDLDALEAKNRYFIASKLRCGNKTHPVA